MWDKLKEILKASNEKAVIVEDGEPKYVVLSVDEYLKLSQGKSGNIQQQQNTSQDSPAPAPSLNSSPFAGDTARPAENGSPQPLPTDTESESIFRGSVNPTDADAPVDLGDIDFSGHADLADSDGPAPDVRLDDLPL